jgi:hypothetical protein
MEKEESIVEIDEGIGDSIQALISTIENYDMPSSEKMSSTLEEIHDVMFSIVDRLKVLQKKLDPESDDSVFYT